MDLQNSPNIYGGLEFCSRLEGKDTQREGRPAPLLKEPMTTGGGEVWGRERRKEDIAHNGMYWPTLSCLPAPPRTPRASLHETLFPKSAV